MRLASMLLLAILLSCFSIQARAGTGCGSNWLGNDAVGYDPDFSVSAHQQGYLVQPSSDLAAPSKTASSKLNASSKLETASSKPRIAPDERGATIPQSSGPNMSMPDPSPKPLVKPNTTTNNQTNNVSASQVQAQPEIKLIEVSGKWSVKFNDSTNRSLDLILFTNQERVMGSGTLGEDGTKIPLTASGTVNAKELTLTAKTVIGDYVNQIDRQFDLDLLMVNSTLSGTYLLKSAGKFLGKGNATMAKSGVS
jgi:hypothetical protein